MEVGVEVVKFSRLTVGETGNCDDCGDVMGIAKGTISGRTSSTTFSICCRVQ